MTPRAEPNQGSARACSGLLHTYASGRALPPGGSQSHSASQTKCEGSCRRGGEVTNTGTNSRSPTVLTEASAGSEGEGRARRASRLPASASIAPTVASRTGASHAPRDAPSIGSTTALTGPRPNSRTCPSAVTHVRECGETNPSCGWPHGLRGPTEGLATGRDGTRANRADGGWEQEAADWTPLGVMPDEGQLAPTVLTTCLARVTTCARSSGSHATEASPASNAQSAR